MASDNYAALDRPPTDQEFAAHECLIRAAYVEKQTEKLLAFIRAHNGLAVIDCAGRMIDALNDVRSSAQEMVQ